MNGRNGFLLLGSTILFFAFLVSLARNSNNAGIGWGLVGVGFMIGAVACAISDLKAPQPATLTRSADDAEEARSSDGAEKARSSDDAGDR
ncbi:hypothetical protein [Sphaerisporangium corydalis]|uniref:Uncharacterized protein n=1 Tax=Sphaerisporangium corydalis TaxID=1441875 RepID=A0ABV9EF42_9ACTN|nr:hypothetical protein [Sphaerisporangium corydalis]